NALGVVSVLEGTVRRDGKRVRVSTQLVDARNDWLAALALADVALGRKEQSIQEGRRAMEMLPISEDAVDGPFIAIDFALVCAWANQFDLAFEQLNTVIQMPNWFLCYGDLKTNP